MVKNKFEHGIRILHTDNACEYVNHDFRAYLNEEGIEHECTAPNASGQNGYAQKEMRTIVENVRSMLYARDVPLNLWAEAVNCHIYLMNRTSSSLTKDVSPYENWNGCKPRLEHIRVFGSEAYVHVTSKKTKKLYKISKKMMLVGYDNENYRMYDTETREILISRNVDFNESITPVLKKNVNMISISEDVQQSNKRPQTSTLSHVVASPDRSSSMEEDTSDDSLRSCEDDDVTYEPPRSVVYSDEVDARHINLRPRIPRKDANLSEFDLASMKEVVQDKLKSYKEPQ